MLPAGSISEPLLLGAAEVGALVAAEEILKAAVDAAIQAAETRKAKAGAVGLKNKRKSDTSDEDKDLLFRNAGDFVEWWRNE